MESKLKSKITADNIAILSLDVGTTNFKCSLYDKNLECFYSVSTKLQILQPNDGYYELNAESLFNIIEDNIKRCVEHANEKNYKITSLGLSTQRNSIILWNKYTDEKYCNFILWNDRRSSEICNYYNNAFHLSTVTKLAKLYSSVIPSHHFVAISKYKMETTHVSPRLIQQIRILQSETARNFLKSILYGTIDTWLIYYLTKEKTFATDITCACSSGFFDIFLDKWSKILCYLFNIPSFILPEVQNSCYDYGTVKTYLIKNPVHLTACVGDVQSSFIAECAFQTGDVVITAGTGGFISVNVGENPVASKHGNYPLIAYRYKRNVAYMLHATVSSLGVCLEWAKIIGLIEDFNQIDNILKETESSNGVTFFPGFGLLNKQDLNSKFNSPSYEQMQTASFCGLKPSTTKVDMLRAIIDSMIFSIKVKFSILKDDLDDLRIKINTIKIAGGVAKSDFFCQYLCNLLNYPIERASDCHSSSTKGAAFLAGLGASIWVNLTDLEKYRRDVKIFQPDYSNGKNLLSYELSLETWKKSFF